MKLLFKLGMWKASVKRNGVLDCHVNNRKSCFSQGLELSDEIINCFRGKLVLFVETIPFINLLYFADAMLFHLAHNHMPVVCVLPFRTGETLITLRLSSQITCSMIAS